MFGPKKTVRLNCNDPRRFIGKKGIVSIPIHPDRPGQIAIGGTWYSAICKERLFLAENRLVVVTGIEGNILFVKPLH